MRLWHEELLSRLPRQQLLGQHRECCALRGNGWGKKHATVNYVFDYSPYKLYQFHLKVMDEMKNRGYQNNPLWENPYYRGKACLAHDKDSLYWHEQKDTTEFPIYPEHDLEYFHACVENLEHKGIKIR
ncbi:TIGR02328 family protein [Virgibacillus necropolis]|uniref:Pyrimidine dimer DNA glycosylase n=1 Tax=Virgibacillus necropolis TaxID=163877 RepID=A0A221MFS2_9BACI|nr:TIGR02328 family protein [Virgibacillus necropolis]ASN06475.1 hypothetical protein CFK40_16355 [Virgibacillus necropolis]